MSAFCALYWAGRWPGKQAGRLCVCVCARAVRDGEQAGMQALRVIACCAVRWEGRRAGRQAGREEGNPLIAINACSENKEGRKLIHNTAQKQTNKQNIGRQAGRQAGFK